MNEHGIPDLLPDEIAFVRELASASVGERVKKLRQGLAKVKQIAAQLRELRKQQSDEALKKELLVNETILLMAVCDFEKAGVQPTEERW